MTCAQYDLSQRQKDEQAYQAMRQKILDLCHESLIQGETDYYRTWFKNVKNGFDFNLGPAIAEHKYTHGLSPEINRILNYPMLPQILKECFPGDSTFAKFERWSFKDGLAWNYVDARDRGLAAGILGQVFIAKGIIGAADKLVKLPTLIRWVPYLAKNVGQRLTKWTLITVGYSLFGMFKWTKVKPVNNGKVERVPGTLPYKPVANSSQPAPADANTSSITIDDLFPDISQTRILQLQSTLAQKAALYGPDLKTLRTVKPNPRQIDINDLSSQINSFQSNCLSYIDQYNQMKNADNLQMVKMFCGNYLDTISKSLVLLEKPKVRCDPVNRNVFAYTQAGLNEMLRQLPAEAIDRN